MATFKQILKAKEVLKNSGYYVDNLWTVSDVKFKFNCSDEQAQEILNKSLNNDSTMEQIWLSIDIFGDLEGFERVKEE